jgi:hypothetical protein
MASKKAKTPKEQALIKKRVEFVQSKPNIPKARARQQFFVQTRAAELQTKGVEVTKEKRAQLRQKFQSGDVKRSGFYTDADRARFATSRSGTGSDSSSVVNTGQNLAQYKMLGKENTARRPVAAKQSSGGGFLSGAANLAKRGLEDVANAPLIKFATQQVNSGLESTAATFINPSINLIGEGLNKLAFKKDGQKGGDYNPNLRVAGKMEAATNTVMAVADIFTAGATRSLRIANPTFLTPPAKTGLITKINTKIDKLDNALASRTKAKTAPVTTPKTTARPTGPVTSGTKKSSIPGPGPKTRPSAGTGPKNAAGKPYKSPKEIDIDIKVGNAAEKAAGQKASVGLKKPTATKTAGKKSQAQMQKEADNAVSGGLSKVMNEAPVTKGPDMNSSSLTFVEPKPASAAKPKASKPFEFTDPINDPISFEKKQEIFSKMKPTKSPKANTRKPSGPRPAPKTTRKKAEAGKNFNQKVKQVNSGPQRKIDPKIKKYKSQEDFDKFMNSGGKEVVVQATRANPEVGRAFTEANKEFIKTRSTRSTSQAAARKKRADRRTQAALRLNRIRANQAAKAAGN